MTASSELGQCCQVTHMECDCGEQSKVKHSNSLAESTGAAANSSDTNICFGDTSGRAQRGGHSASSSHYEDVLCVPMAARGHMRARADLGFLQASLPCCYLCTATIVSCCLYRRCCSRVRNRKVNFLASNKNLWSAKPYNMA